MLRIVPPTLEATAQQLHWLTELAEGSLVGEAEPEDIPQRPLTPCLGGQPALVSESFASSLLQCIQMFGSCFFYI